jgi:hypothetical protein
VKEESTKLAKPDPPIIGYSGLLKDVAVEQQAVREVEERNPPCPSGECGPFPEKGGAVGPGEEEFGDPMRCYVDEHTGVYGDKAAAGGAGGCHQGLPAGTWIYACVGVETDAGGKTLGECSHLEVKGHTSIHWAIGDSKAIIANSMK